MVYLAPAPFTLSILSSRTRAIAGDTFSLLCAINSEQELTQDPNFEWMGSNISIESNITGLTVFNSSSTTSTLIFNPLQYIHRGTYRCTASVENVDAGIAISNNYSKTIIVQSKLEQFDHY